MHHRAVQRNITDRLMTDPPRPRRTRPKAVAFILRDLSLSQRSRDEQAIRNLARRHCYDVAQVLVYGSGDFDNPLAEALRTVAAVDATTLIVPDLGHIGGRVSTVRRTCRLVTVDPVRTWERSRR
jgi:hypothetical protein